MNETDERQKRIKKLKKKPVYLVWNEWDDQESDGFWEQFSSLADAVETHGSVEIYIARPRYKGRFRNSVRLIKMRTRKKKK